MHRSKEAERGLGERHESGNMEVDQIKQCKFPRISDGNGRFVSADEIGQSRKMDDEEERDREKVTANDSEHGGGVDLGGDVGRFYGWPSSRIVRVSRASGGRDRHSRVLTSMGLRDRRVRLSVDTALQFYDLQDRLGYDQPSKAVQWLLKAAASSIAELPPTSAPFPDTPKQVSDEKWSSAGGSDQLGFDSAEVDMEGCGGDPASYPHQSQATKSSACSSNSEGSEVSLSRSESRVKARERARERVAEKGKERGQNECAHVASLNQISQTTSFTELLSGGFNNVSNRHNNNSIRHWPSASMDYFTSGQLGQPAIRPGQLQVVNAHRPIAPPQFSAAGDHHVELQTFSFAPDHLVSVANGAGGGNSNISNNHHNGGSEYNLVFAISSESADFNRGTLQSNSSSPPLLPPVQRFPPTDGCHPNFFIGTTAPVENHHQFFTGSDARLQLNYCDGRAYNGRHAGQKGRGKELS